MFPLRTIVPYTLDLDRSRGVAILTQDARDSEARIQLAKYVIQRESYDDAQPRDGIAEVLAMSKDAARRSYLSGLKGGVPDLSRLLYQRGTQVRVVVQGVTISPGGRARATFKAEQRQGASTLSTLPWQANIIFSARPPVAGRTVVVRDYQRSALIGPPEPPTPTIGSSP